MSPEKELEKVSRQLEKNPEEVDLLYRRASLLQQLGRYGEALNDLHRILEKDPQHLQALQKTQYIQTILRFTNTDIFSDTNLDHDPWLE